MKMGKDEEEFLNDLFRGAIIHFRYFNEERAYYAGMNGTDGAGTFFKHWYPGSPKYIEILKVVLSKEVKERINEYLAKL